MNFLAHFYSGRHSDDRILAGFISESVNLPKEKISLLSITEELSFHDELNSFSKSNKAHQRSQNRLQTISQKYKPLMVDLFYDHFITKNWERLAGSDLDSFESYVKFVLQNNFSNLPYKSKVIYTSFFKGCHFSSFKTISGIHSYTSGIKKHISWPIQFVNVFAQFSDSYNEFEMDFQEFIFDLDRYVSEYDQCHKKPLRVA